MIWEAPLRLRPYLIEYKQTGIYIGYEELRPNTLAEVVDANPNGSPPALVAVVVVITCKSGTDIKEGPRLM
ncbi:hypothetical protein MLD38_015501 [Melastoma candidum]|uniref:Uncharacterized protein n=1 Tax=Melastoma candidum TaxID=119954 RepID=A0ACB9RI85_9MYRT|nr:hypothetical protein MLD38_015501 [Melastoma candidum]